MELLLGQNRNKVSRNEHNSLAVNFIGSKRMLPCEPMSTTVNEIDVYNQERLACEKIRLTVEINPICTNVLFNNFTEIVKDEGSENVLCLNYGECSNDLNKCKDTIYFKNNKTIYDGDSYEAIRDTQLSSVDNGYDYHCGLDIFNNHLLRSKTFKTVCPLEKTLQPTDDFNTIEDNMREYGGQQKKGYEDKETGDRKPKINLHLYMNDEISSFKDCVNTKLIEKDGWFGFTNIGKLKVYDSTDKNQNFDWFKVITAKNRVILLICIPLGIYIILTQNIIR